MLGLLLALAHSQEHCSRPVTRFYNTANTTAVSHDSLYYFYSEYILLGDTLTVHVNSDVDVELFVGSNLFCPSATDEPAATIQKGTAGTFSVSASDQPGLKIFGIRAKNTGESGTAVIGVSGTNPNNSDLGSWQAISGLFVGCCFVLLVLLFVHSILARSKVHYQVEVNE